MKKSSDYPIGSVVYYIKKNGHVWTIDFGTVDEAFPGVLSLQLYDTKDKMRINGIPKKEFETPTKWKKLPKDWNYRTELFRITYDNSEDMSYSIKTTSEILKAIENGIVVKVQDNDYANFESEIDKELGYRIIRKYRDYHPRFTSIRVDDVYDTFDDALKVVKEHKAELKRQSSLTDKEWSIEQINKTLSKWAAMYSISDAEKNKYLDWLLKLENIVDVEVRIQADTIQWKYSKNKKWLNIEV